MRSSGIDSKLIFTWILKLSIPKLCFNLSTFEITAIFPNPWLTAFDPCNTCKDMGDLHNLHLWNLKQQVADNGAQQGRFLNLGPIYCIVKFINCNYRWKSMRPGWDIIHDRQKSIVQTLLNLYACVDQRIISSVLFNQLSPSLTVCDG